MTITDFATVKTRALSDMLQSERAMRTAAEQTVRDLYGLLSKLAVRLDGARLEAMRRENPAIPSSWTVHDWQHFFNQIQSSAGAWPTSHGAGKEQELQARVRTLESRLAELQAQLQAKAVKTAPEKPQKKNSPQISAKKTGIAAEKATEKTFSVPAALGTPQTAIPDGMTPSLSTMVAAAAALLPGLPAKPPAAFSKALNGNGRRGNDLKRAYLRYWIVLYAIGRWGINSQMEVMSILGILLGLSPNSGSLRRILDDLDKANLVESGLLRMSKAPASALKLFHLTEDGKRLFSILFEQAAAESEWERLNRLHEGERFPEHTLAVLIFALHARRRGWATQILPETEGNAVPDIAVLRDKKYYVEVERSIKEKPSKWRNLAKLNGGAVALCAMTPQGRHRLVSDCKLAKIQHGVATDLKTLIAVKYNDVGAETPLWDEAW